MSFSQTSNPTSQYLVFCNSNIRELLENSKKYLISSILFFIITFFGFAPAFGLTYLIDAESINEWSVYLLYALSFVLIGLAIYLVIKKLIYINNISLLSRQGISKNFWRSSDDSYLFSDWVKDLKVLKNLAIAEIILSFLLPLIAIILLIFMFTKHKKIRSIYLTALSKKGLIREED